MKKKRKEDPNNDQIGRRGSELLVSAALQDPSQSKGFLCEGSQYARHLAYVIGASLKCYLCKGFKSVLALRWKMFTEIIKGHIFEKVFKNKFTVSVVWVLILN